MISEYELTYYKSEETGSSVKEHTKLVYKSWKSSVAHCWIKINFILSQFQLGLDCNILSYSFLPTNSNLVLTKIKLKLKKASTWNRLRHLTHSLKVCEMVFVYKNSRKRQNFLPELFSSFTNLCMWYLCDGVCVLMKQNG